jgi:translation elongation factor EF-4
LHTGQSFCNTYEQVTGYKKNDLVKLEIKINGEPAEPLSVVVHRDAAYRVGKALVSKLKELIPRQMFRCDAPWRSRARSWQGRAGQGTGALFVTGR